MPPSKTPDDLDDLERAALAAIEALRRIALHAANVAECDAINTAADCAKADVRWLLHFAHEAQEARDA